jgi:uncharacterized membrane protein
MISNEINPEKSLVGHNLRKDIIKNIKEDYAVNDKKAWRFWEEIFIYYWIFSLAGHYLEIFWSYVNFWIRGGHLWMPTDVTIIPLAPPYGIGAIAVIAVVWPIVRKHRMHPITVTFLNVIIASVVEYLCAIYLVITFGKNIYWNYSHEPFNINGFICLQNSVLFGIGSTFFIYYIYPFFEKAMSKLKKYQMSIIFWILFLSYTIDLVHSFLTR